MEKADCQSQVGEVIKRYQGEEGALMAVLQEVQEILGYLPEEILVKIAEELRLPLSRIWELEAAKPLRTLNLLWKSSGA